MKNKLFRCSRYLIVGYIGIAISLLIKPVLATETENPEPDIEITITDKIFNQPLYIPFRKE